MIRFGFIVFQNILHEDQYTFACIWANFLNTFSIPNEIPPKHGFWMHQKLLQSIAVLFMHRYMIYHLCKYCTVFNASGLYFFNISLHQFTWASFWTFVRFCEVQREQIFFMAKYLCNILLILVKLKPKDNSISWYITCWSCFTSSSTASIFCSTIADFGWPSQNSSWSKLQPWLNLLY